MVYVMELMHYAHYLIKVNAAIAPNQVITERYYIRLNYPRVQNNTSVDNHQYCEAVQDHLCR